MILWIILLALTGVTLVWVGWPLLRPNHSVTGREAYDATVYIDQLGELERDQARGLIDESQAEAARTEIERRLLAVSRAEKISAPPRVQKHWGLAIGLLLALPLVSIPLYVDLGSPGLPNQPFAERAPVTTAPSGIVAQARARLEAAERRTTETPDDPKVWFDLGRLRLVSGEVDSAVTALARALELGNGRPDIASAYGEALSRQADGQVTPESRRAFETALAGNNSDPRALYFLALADYQAGREEDALEAWSALGRSAPIDAPWLPAVQARIAETARELGEDPRDWLPPQAAAAAAAARGPSSDDVAAAQQMTPEERQDMIRGMVANLAARLEDEPNDVEGWRRLARSREVLGDTEGSAQAYDKALVLEPDHPETLLRGALTAAERGDDAVARTRFVRLQKLVPPDSEVHRMVSEAISRIDQPGAAAAPVPGPSADDVAAAQQMTPGDRQDMIRGMVANLAARLEDEPNDVEGWRRLAHSLDVLGDTAGSAQAYDKALVLEPDHPETLLRSARTAAKNGNDALARTRFVRLQKLVPPDSEVHRMVSEAISRIDQADGSR